MEEKEIECAGFTFVTNFDSANLSRVEFVPRKPLAPVEPTPKQNSKKCQSATARFVQKRTKPAAIEFPDFEFNLWTNPDCSGTEFENSNRTWFHFGVKGGPPFSLVRLNIVDLNKQSKMYSQGMAPVYKICPGRCHWERIRDKPVFTQENNVFTLSFKFRTLENPKATTYFAFTYPFSYMDLQNYLSGIDVKMAKPENHLPKTEIRFNKGLRINNDINDAIYYHRETLCHSLENRNVDLITISSHHNITAEREPRIQKLFPDENTPRAFKFQEKKVVFISARVHPGETPSSFVFNGLLNLLVQKDDPIAILLRRQYVFKLIPMLNPDGVARGHYRTDTRGCNLNRYYLNPSKELQPSIYAARALIRYHHFGAEVEDDAGNESFDASSQADPTDSAESECSSIPDVDPPERPSFQIENQISDLILTEKNNSSMEAEETDRNPNPLPDLPIKDLTIRSSSSDYVSVDNLEDGPATNLPDEAADSRSKTQNDASERLSSGKRNGGKAKSGAKKEAEGAAPESGLFLYIDMHGHASKKGIFMYGNHFDKIEDSVECMLLPKIMSVNSQNFHFTACNFTEKNMYLRDKRDGTSREGSGRVAVLRITGLVRSYTLECNYNTGRFVNTLPQCARDLPGKSNTNLLVPPKYNPLVFEEIGRSLGVSILDLTNSNPWSRIPNSEYHTLFGMRDWLRLKSLSESFLYQRVAPRSSLRPRPSNKSSQTQVVVGILRPDRVPSKILPNLRLAPLHSKQPADLENNPEDSERKENLTTFGGSSSSSAAVAVVGKKEPVPSHSKRSIGRVGTVLQAHRAAGPRTVRSLSAGSKKTVFRTSEKLSKFKQYSHKSDVPSDEGTAELEKRVTLSTVSLGLNCDNDRPRSKIPPLSDQCIFKQNPKRLKISKLEDGNKLKISDWVKEDAVPGPSSSDLVVYSRLSRPLTQLTNGTEHHGLPKKRPIKTRSQLSPLKYKKSLEKRRGSDTSRKKSKTLFKKAGKIVLTTTDLNKSLIDRKRRKN